MSQTIYELKSFGQKRFRMQQFDASARSLRTLLNSYDIDPLKIAATKEGVENQTFMVDTRDQQYVLRVYRKDKKTTLEIEAEIDFMEFLGERGLPVPRVVPNKRARRVTEHVIDGTRWQCILMKRIPGQHPTVFTKRLLSELARLQARLHVLGAEYALERGAQSGRHIILATRQVDIIRLPYGYSHFDITTYNLLVKNGHITGLLDFDDMSFGPFADCLAITILRSSDIVMGPRLRKAYLADYQAVRPLMWRERQRLRTHLLLNRRPFSVALRLRSNTSQGIEQ
ncbi:MAG TPA: phosphotransferase [Candidatus Saccharimonadia bacterium]|nr:phosphotransferase [Candidatus Saccharimonadia bacterium]